MKKLAALLTLCLITVSCEPVIGDKFYHFFDIDPYSGCFFNLTAKGGVCALGKNSTPVDYIVIEEWFLQLENPQKPEKFSFGENTEDLLGTFSGNWCEVTINKNDVIVVVKPNDTSIDRHARIYFAGKPISTESYITINQAANKTSEP